MIATTGCFSGNTESGFAGPGRLVDLARASLLDLRRQLADDSLSDARVQTLVVAPDHEHETACIEVESRDLGDYRDAVMAMRTARLRDVMDTETRGLDRELASTLAIWRAHSAGNQWFRGRTGFAAATLAAAAALEDGRATVCLLGAFDSLLDAETLDALYALDLLKGPDNPVGVIPGEAAVVFVLRAHGSRSPSLPPIATIDAVVLDAVSTPAPASGRPPADGGRQLAKVVEACLPSEASSVHLVADLNGDERRSSEWGHAAVTAGWPRTAATTFLASAFGETGSAAGAVAAAFAVHGWNRRAAVPDSCVVTLSELHGAKAAIRLSAHRES
jgi:hypothetical protein